MVILFRSLLVPVVIRFAVSLAVIGGFVSVAVIGHATTIIIGLAVSLQATTLPVAVIAAGICIAYSVADGLYGVALAATAMLSAVMLSMTGIVVAAAILTPIAMPAVLTSRILMAILPILPIFSIFSISTNAMVSLVTIAYAILVVNGLVYLLMVILLLAIIGAFVALAVIGHVTISAGHVDRLLHGRRALRRDRRGRGDADHGRRRGRNGLLRPHPPTTPAGSRGWPSWRTRCAPSPMRSTPSSARPTSARR
jgi:hypothetical protein